MAMSDEERDGTSVAAEVAVGVELLKAAVRFMDVHANTDISRATTERRMVELVRTARFRDDCPSCRRLRLPLAVVKRKDDSGKYRIAHYRCDDCLMVWASMWIKDRSYKIDH